MMISTKRVVIVNVMADLSITLLEILIASVAALTGLVGLVFVLRKRHYLFWPILVAFLFRTSAAVAHRIFFILPMGQTDAQTFEQRAWDWASAGCGNLLDLFPAGSSYVHSWIIANIYACTDRAPLLFQSITVLFGVLTVYLVARIAERLWDRPAARRAAWVAALFPFLALYSAVPLRESWFTAPLMLGLLWLVIWAQEGGLSRLAGAMLAFVVAAVFHGGAIFAAIVASLLILLWGVQALLRGLVFERVRLTPVIGLLFIIVITPAAIALQAQHQIGFSSIGDLAAMAQPVEAFELRVRDEPVDARAQYADFLMPSGTVDFLVLSPARMIYLVGAPFPWDIRAIPHVIGFFDGLLYIGIIFLLWYYRRFWWHRTDFRMLVFILLALIFIYGWGTTNFGTGVRHRAKLVGILIALAAGLLGRSAWVKNRLHAAR